MHTMIVRYKDTIRDLCIKYGVVKLEIFGSAAVCTDDRSNDFDFLIQFKTKTPVEYSKGYFSLKNDLEELLGKPVDLVEMKELKNPYFLKVIEQNRKTVYAA